MPYPVLLKCLTEGMVYEFNKGDFYAINLMYMVSNTKIEITPAAAALQKDVSADYSVLLLLPVAAIAVQQYTKKQMRKAGRKMMWQLVKMKVKSLFSFKKDNAKAKTVKWLLILLGLGFVAAIGIFLSWTIAITILVVFGLVAIVFSARN